MSGTIAVCEEGSTLTIVNGEPSCPNWVIEEFIAAPQLLAVLESIDQFDGAMVASITAYYLLLFSLGFIAGTVIKVMKKA